jgi:hypothetical protein
MELQLNIYNHGETHFPNLRIENTIPRQKHLDNVELKGRIHIPVALRCHLLAVFVVEIDYWFLGALVEIVEAVGVED